MSNPEDRDFLLHAAIETKAIRVGHARTSEGEHAEPIFATSSYVFDSAEAAAERFSGDLPGNVYSRYTNPTVRAFEKRLAAMEDAESAVATSSGMAAILSTCMAFLSHGDHVVCSESVFGTTTVLFNKYLAKMGVETSFVPATDYAAWQKAITDKTQLCFLETPSNPLCEIVDIQKIAHFAHEYNALLVVDNCFCTPALQKPLALGADLVIHSATKYLDGQGRCLGGAVVGKSILTDEVLAFLRTAGPTMSPFNAWICLKGLETLTLRMNAHSQSALLLAQWLDEQPVVEKVFYAGLENHPGHHLAVKQQTAFGGVLSFRLCGDKQQAMAMINATQLMSITANLGDTKTTIIHPATTTHSRLSEQNRASVGITDNLIRISVGLEALSDLKADLSQAFAVIG